MLHRAQWCAHIKPVACYPNSSDTLAHRAAGQVDSGLSKSHSWLYAVAAAAAAEARNCQWRWLAAWSRMVVLRAHWQWLMYMHKVHCDRGSYPHLSSHSKCPALINYQINSILLQSAPATPAPEWFDRHSNIFHCQSNLAAGMGWEDHQTNGNAIKAEVQGTAHCLAQPAPHRQQPNAGANLSKWERRNEKGGGGYFLAILHLHLIMIAGRLLFSV